MSRHSEEVWFQVMRDALSGLLSILFGTATVLIFNSLVSRSHILKLPSSNFIFIILEDSMMTAHGLLLVLCMLLPDMHCLIMPQPCCFILITFIRDLRIFIKYHTWSCITREDVWLLGWVQWLSQHENLSTMSATQSTTHHRFHSICTSQYLS
jgi:hypothetical protein